MARTARQLTRHAATIHEAGVRFSPDGKRILYYRIPAGEAVDNNTYGTYDLVIADADGCECRRVTAAISRGRRGGRMERSSPASTAAASGSSTSPAGKRSAQLPRKGIVQQLVWSPDGASFAGTANGLGPLLEHRPAGREDGAIERRQRDRTLQLHARLDARLAEHPLLAGHRPGDTAATPRSGWPASTARRSGCSTPRKAATSTAAAPLPMAITCSSPGAKPTLARWTTREPAWRSSGWRTRPLWSGRPARPRSRSPGARRGPMLDLSWGWEPHWTYAEHRPTPAAGR